MYACVPTINPLSKTNIAFEIEGAGVSPVSALEQLYKEVILPRLCAACGACVGNCPYLVKFRGRTVKLDSCSRAEGRCYAYCPSANFDPESISQAIFSHPYDTTGLGSFTEARASRSTSNEILTMAQGGGTVTSLMSMALEADILDAAIVTSAKGSDGFPVGVIATTARAVQESTGSKFVGAHSLDALKEALDRGFSRIGIVGLPCQVRSLRKMQLYDMKDQHLKDRIRLVVGLFCNWSFSADEFQSFITKRIGNKNIRKFDVPPPPSKKLIVETDDGAESIALEDLTPLIQGACRECPDMTSEFADISVGMYEGRPGWNTLMIRSKTGLDLIETATHVGVIETERFPEENLAHLRQASINKKERVSLAKTETGGFSSMSRLILDEPGKEILFMGNEAIARGALEAGVRVAAAYPGNPSSEIIGNLAQVAEKMGIYVEWSVNEKVAAEVAAAAAVSNMNALVAMKQNGLNVACDFLLNLNLTGIRGGLVVIVADDPSGISSSNEQDSRSFAKLADIPLLEPSGFQEAKEMVRHAFELSRMTGNFVMIRSVTRISHARGNVILGKLPRDFPSPYFDTSRPLCPLPTSVTHPALHKRLQAAEKILEDSEFNEYWGPETPETLIITCGSGWFFSREAVDILGLRPRVGVLKIGTTWPLPRLFLINYLQKTKKVIFFEEVDPVLENNVTELYAQHNLDLPRIEFVGKNSGDVPRTGELSPDLILGVLGKVTGVILKIDENYANMAKDAIENYAPQRAMAFCAGCPHRASLWAIKQALALDGRDGVLFGDIGCYALGIFSTGFSQLKTVHAMGSGAGMACGFGSLRQFGVNQPSLAVCGDSTFFHAVIPVLVNAVHQNSKFLLVVLDNNATAMTGFQPHPGSPIDAMGNATNPIVIEDLCASLGLETRVMDPFDLKGTISTVCEMIKDQTKPKALVLRRECALVSGRKGTLKYKVRIDPQKCIGEECGCDRLCTRVFKCPGLIWNRSTKKARIDDVICTGCGVCADICPSHAIAKESV